MSEVVEEGKKEDVTPKELLFTKQQLLNSQKYREQRDLLNAVLDDDDSYTAAEVERKIKSFLGKKGKVNK